MNKTLLSAALAVGCTLCAAVPAEAQRLVVKTETYGNNYDIDNSQVAKLVTNFYDSQNHLTRSNLAAQTALGMQLQTYTVYTNDANGEPLSALTTQAKPTSGDNVDNEFTFENYTLDTWERDAQGRPTKYYQQKWSKKATMVDGSYQYTYQWVAAPGWERDYNADGTVSQLREWISQYKAENPGAPQNTCTYTYENGRVVLGHNDGSYTSNKWEDAYTYNAAGQLTEVERTYWEESKQDAPLIQRVAYVYDAQGNLVEEITQKTPNGKEENLANSLKVTYAPVNGNTDVVARTNWEWNKNRQEWVEKGGQKNIDYYADLTDKGEWAPQTMINPAEGTISDIEVAFMVNPEAAALNPRYDIYRDGAMLMSKTLAELQAEERYNAEGMAAMVTLAKQPAGQHDYYVQLCLPGADGDEYLPYNISDVVPYNVEVALPAVADFKIESVETRTTQGVQEYVINLSWKNPDDMADFGFKRHKFFTNHFGFDVDRTDSPEATTFSLVVEEAEGKVWMQTDYELGSAVSDTLSYAYTLPAEKLPAYGFCSGIYASYLAQYDMNQPSEKPENIWDLEELGISDFVAGASYGQGYVGFYFDDNWGKHFAGFNFETKTLTPYHEVKYGEAEENVTSLAYSVLDDEMYAVGYDFDQDYNYIAILYKLNPATSYFEKVGQLDAYIEQIAYLNGKLYGVAMPDYTETYLYQIDPENLTCQRIEFDGALTPGDWSDSVSFTAHDGLLYYTVGTKAFLLNPTMANWKELSQDGLSKAVKGLTFKWANEDADITVGTPGSQGAGRKLVATTYYGDIMGMLSDDTPSIKDVNYYDFDGRQIAAIETARDINDPTFHLAYYTTNAYDEAGNITESVRKQKGDWDYGLPALKEVEKTLYTYNEEGQLTEKATGDDWHRYAYNRMGALETETIGCGDDTYQVLTYLYDFDFTHPAAIASTSPQHPDWTGNIYVEVFQYNANGDVEVAERYTDDTYSKVISSTKYTYFDGTNILQLKEVFAPASDDATELSPESRITYTPIDGDLNNLEVLTESCWDGVWTRDGKRTEQYVDFSSFAGLAEQINLSVNAVEDAKNEAALVFNAPMFMMYQQAKLDIYRDGELLMSLDPEAVANYMDEDLSVTGPVLVVPDKEVRNGNHTYFVEPYCATGGDEIEGGFTYTGLQASNLAAVDFNLELPAVTGLNVAGQHKEVVNDPQSGSYEATFATVEWVNPANVADFGFEENCLFLDNFQTPAATAAEGATSAEMNLGEQTVATIFVQSRYVYGYVNSDAITYTVGSTGLNGVYTADGLTITVANGTATVSEAAVINVFDMGGRLVATANGTSIDLRHLKGNLVITATTPSRRAAVKANN